MAKRITRSPAVRLAHDYARAAWPRARLWCGMRLGLPRLPGDGGEHSPEEIRMGYQWCPRAQVIAGREEGLAILAGSFLQPLQLLGYLHFWARHVPQTAELLPWWGRPLELVAVLPWVDPDVAALLEDGGVQVAVYSPEWALVEMGARDWWVRREAGRVGLPVRAYLQLHREQLERYRTAPAVAIPGG